MKNRLSVRAFILGALASLGAAAGLADDAATAPPRSPPGMAPAPAAPPTAAFAPVPSSSTGTDGAAQASAGRPRGAAPGLATSPLGVAQSAPAANGATVPDPATFVTEEKWGMAGYNNNEPIYTILVTSHDARIIRCTADLKGTYIENGEKRSIADRQTTTVFPNQQVQIGNWSGMDQQSGATYSVKCRPI
ncbi:MAG: hypothetical protein ABSH33_05825 [Steroidobacteraceae bacterium]|jgi:hypothetical protein